MACRFLVCVHVETGIDQFLVQAGGLRNRINNQLTNHVHMRRDVQLNIHFKTVTGGKNYCTLNTELTCDIRRQNIGYARAPALNAATVVKSTVWCDATNA